MNQKGSAIIYLLLFLAVLSLSFIKSKSINQSSATPAVSPQVQEHPKPSTEPKISQEQLQKYLTVEAALLGVSDNISLYFKDLDQNKEVSIEPTRSWIPASTIKSFVVLEAFRQRSVGLINFNDEITIKSENVVPTELETDEFPRLKEGTKATIRQLVEAMIIQSDNIAYNTLLDILDRRNINLSLKNIGITETVVGEKLNLDEVQFQKDLQVAGRQSNTTTVKDLTTFFDLLYNKKIANAEEILDIFKRQKINDMIPALLPTSTIVAHKTGEWAPIYHDAGVVFKPLDPFILTIFSNSDNPKIVAELAKVAYFQNAESVGKAVSLNEIHISYNLSSINLTQQPNASEVLAAQTPEKFPEVSASDLGITQKDLNFNPQQAKDFLGAIITPGSFFYNVKKFFENNQINNAKDNSSLAKTYLNLSKNRLSEAKSLISSGDFKTADISLKESEKDLEKATELSKNDPNKDLLLLNIKRANDLHYAVLAERAPHVDDSKKEQFIDNVYNFYKENHQKVTPVINTSVVANPTQQKPAVGIITEIHDNQAKIQFDDGSSKQVILPEDTKVRNFQEEFYSSVNTIKQGDKVAVVGLSNSDAQIIPQFILKNVPKELPERHQGTVIEIKPDENTMKILDKKGAEKIIKINFSTAIKSKDTNVSLEGIKAGSKVTVFGTTQPSSTPNDSFVFPSVSATPSITTPSSTSTSTSQTKSIQLINSPAPSTLLLPTIKSSSNPPSTNVPKKATTPQPTTSSKQTTTTEQSSRTPSTEGRTPSTKTQSAGIQATSITITQNSSGKHEKIELKQSTPPKQEPPKQESSKKEESKKAPVSPKQPEAPKKEEPKPTPKK